MNKDTYRVLENSQPIAAVERETDIAKDTLRVWEKRYDFPKPLRDTHGNRVYPPEQVEQLRLIRQLLDAGYRPGKVVGLASEKLEELRASLLSQQTADLSKTNESKTTVGDVGLESFLQAIEQQDPERLRHLLQHAQAKLGLAEFVVSLVAPLTTAVGEAWAQGRFVIHEEHLYTEIITGVLHQAIAALAPVAGLAAQARPKVLLTTIPQEPHGLGLLMVEVMLALEGCRCVSLGTQTPLSIIVEAAQAHQVDIVALSFSIQPSSRVVLSSLKELRAQLPAHIALWAGGANTALYQRPLEGMTVTPLLTDLDGCVAQWRALNS